MNPPERNQQQPRHQPAMVDETLQFLEPQPGKVILDMTVGVGGHARHLLKHGCQLIGLDRDRESLKIAQQNLARYEDRVRLFWGRMSEVEDIFWQHELNGVDGCLIDAGISMDQMLDERRGFSAHSDESLDMRMDRSDAEARTAHQIVNEYLEKDLIRVFSIVSRRREARRVARRIVQARERTPIHTTAQLAELIEAQIARGRPSKPAHAAPYLLAIRAEVNDELDELQAGIEAGCGLLNPTGKLVTLTWHSAEHRVSKQTMRRLANPRECLPALSFIPEDEPKIRLLTPNLLHPTEEEVRQNPSARSVRLNAAEKLEVDQ